MNKLENWYNQFADIKQLSFDEAKEKYENAMNIKNAVEKEDIINEIIIGTTSVIYNYVKKYMTLYETGAYDIEDILDTFMEQWIIAIKSGALLNNNSFNNIINNHNFLNGCCIKLTGDNAELELYNKQHLEKSIYVYFKMRNQNEDVTLDEFVYEMCNESITELWRYSQLDEEYINMKRAIVRFNECKRLYDTILTLPNSQEYFEIILSTNKIKDFMPIFIDILKQGELPEEVYRVLSMEEKIVYKVFIQELNEAIHDLSLSDEDMELIKRLFGLDNTKCESFKTVQESMNISREKLFSMISRIRRKMTKNEDMVKFEGDAR